MQPKVDIEGAGEFAETEAFLTRDRRLLVSSVFGPWQSSEGAGVDEIYGSVEAYLLRTADLVEQLGPSNSRANQQQVETAELLAGAMVICAGAVVDALGILWWSGGASARPSSGSNNRRVTLGSAAA